jgi:hypothetical protein
LDTIKFIIKLIIVDNDLREGGRGGLGNFFIIKYILYGIRIVPPFGHSLVKSPSPLIVGGGEGPR